MIFNILFFIILSVLGLFTFWLPGSGEVPLLLPYGIDGVFVTMSSYYHGLIETLPYLGVVFQVFLYALLFEFALLVLRLFLGSRAPTNVN